MYFILKQPCIVKKYHPTIDNCQLLNAMELLPQDFMRKTLTQFKNELNDYLLVRILQFAICPHCYSITYTTKYLPIVTLYLYTNTFWCLMTHTCYRNQLHPYTCHYHIHLCTHSDTTNPFWIEELRLTFNYPYSVRFTLNYPYSVRFTINYPYIVRFTLNYPYSVRLTLNYPYSVRLTLNYPYSVRFTLNYPYSVRFTLNYTYSVRFALNYPYSVRFTLNYTYSVRFTLNYPYSVRFTLNYPYSVRFTLNYPYSVMFITTLTV